MLIFHWTGFVEKLMLNQNLAPMHLSNISKHPIFEPPKSLWNCCRNRWTHRPGFSRKKNHPWHAESSRVPGKHVNPPRPLFTLLVLYPVWDLYPLVHWVTEIKKTKKICRFVDGFPIEEGKVPVPCCVYQRLTELLHPWIFSWLQRPVQGNPHTYMCVYCIL